MFTIPANTMQRFKEYHLSFDRDIIYEREGESNGKTQAGLSEERNLM